LPACGGFENKLSTGRESEREGEGNGSSGTEEMVISKADTPFWCPLIRVVLEKEL